KPAEHGRTSSSKALLPTSRKCTAESAKERPITVSPSEYKCSTNIPTSSALLPVVNRMVFAEPYKPKSNGFDVQTRGTITSLLLHAIPRRKCSKEDRQEHLAKSSRGDLRRAHAVLPTLDMATTMTLDDPRTNSKRGEENQKVFGRQKNKSRQGPSRRLRLCKYAPRLSTQQNLYSPRA